MHKRRPVLSLLIPSALLLLTPFLLCAADAPALVMENNGLQNTYRVVFREFDTENHFMNGVIEILNDDSDRKKPETVITFTGEFATDAKDKKTENLTVRCVALLSFFPPADKKDPYPELKWKLTGRTAGKPVLKASFWEFNADKEIWAPITLEFEKAAP